MAHDRSPAVDRAGITAREAAAAAGASAVRLLDWLTSLTADEDGKPAVLLTAAGVDVGALVQRLGSDPTPAPSEVALWDAAREKAIALRGDPTVTTEMMLLAVLAADSGFRGKLTALGVHTFQLERRLAAARTDVASPADPDPGPTFTVAEPTDRADAGRVLDANLNRGREALRVIDDYCRFVLADATLTEEAKSLRHELAELAAGLPVLAARDTPGDVGTSLTAGNEYERRSPAEVAAINLKRLQEALRSVEEFGKLFGPEVGRKAEALRYRAYTLERAAVGGSARSRLAGVNLYLLLTGSQCVASLDWTIAEAAAGGVGVVQLREKSLSDRELLARARDMRRWTRAAGVLFIVNDRPDIARLSEADGVHLGQDDLPVSAARRVLGTDALIGVSTHSVEQVRRAVLDGADYLGVGPTFPSRTKSFDSFPGLDFVREATAATSLPLFALGGVEPGNVHQVRAAGGTRVAVSGCIATADEPRLVAAQLRAALAGSA